MKNNTKYNESFRHTRVKMHKSGKHWVRTIMSRIGTIRLGGLVIPSLHKTRQDELIKPAISPETVLKGAGAIGALLGGAALGTDQAFAEDTVMASEVSTTTVMTNEVVLETAREVEVSEVPVSESVSQASQRQQVESTTEATSVLASQEASVSVSQSQSVSVSESIFESVSTSASLSLSESVSNSASLSQSESVSQSISTSLSSSETDSKQVVEKSESKEQTAARQQLEQVASTAQTFVNGAEARYGNSQSESLQTAMVTSRAEIASAQALLGQTTASLAELQAAVSAVTNSTQILATELVKESRSKNVNAATMVRETAFRATTASATSVTVNSWNEFVAAISNNSITEIQLGTNLTATSNAAYAGHEVVIKGNGNTLNLGAQTINSSTINLTFDNLTLNTTNPVGPVVTTGDGNLTYKDSTIAGVMYNGGAKTAGNVTVTIDGKVTNTNSVVNTTATERGANINLAANVVTTDGSVLNMERTQDGDGIRIKAGGSVKVGNYSNVTITLKDGTASNLVSTERSNVEVYNTAIRAGLPVDRVAGTVVTGAFSSLNLNVGHGVGVVLGQSINNTNPGANI